MLAVTRPLARSTTSGLARTTSSTLMSATVASMGASLRPPHRAERSMLTILFFRLFLLAVTFTTFCRLGDHVFRSTSSLFVHCSGSTPLVRTLCATMMIPETTSSTLFPLLILCVFLLFSGSHPYCGLCSCLNRCRRWPYRLMFKSNADDEQYT